MDDPRALRPMDIAWQAYQKGAHEARRFPLAILSAAELLEDGGSRALNAEFMKWWRQMRELGHGPCAMCHYDAEQAVGAAWNLFVPREAPSLNERVFNTGNKAHVYRRERDAWCLWFRSERLRLKIPEARTKRRVVMTRIYGGRQKQRDFDNLVGGMKCVVDALVIEKLIMDDNANGVELHYAQRESPTRRGLDVRIEEIS